VVVTPKSAYEIRTLIWRAPAKQETHYLTGGEASMSVCAPIGVLTSKESVECIQRVVLPELEKGGVMEYIQLWGYNYSRTTGGSG
jgi:hypothetical protein